MLESKIFRYFISVVLFVLVMYLFFASYYQNRRFKFIKSEFEIALTNNEKQKLYDLEASEADKNNFIEAFINRNNTKILKQGFVDYYDKRIQNASSKDAKDAIKSDIESNTALNDNEKSELLNKIHYE